MKLSIKGISTKALIGCYEHERNATQEVVIDMHIELYSNNWVRNDVLDSTVDSDGVVDFIQEFVAKTSYQLLESLVEDLVNALLDEYSLISNVLINATKLEICGLKAREISVSHSKGRQFKVALALGSNDNLAQQQIITAIEILGEYVSDIEIGGFYATAPVGYLEQNNFVNTALTGYVSLLAHELLGKIKALEKLMGRHEVFVNGPRCIDIDLIFFDDLVYEHNFLSIPHKSAHERDFVLKPLKDVAPDWMHPVLGKTVSELLEQISDRSVLNQIEYYK